MSAAARPALPLWLPTALAGGASLAWALAPGPLDAAFTALLALCVWRGAPRFGAAPRAAWLAGLGVGAVGGALLLLVPEVRLAPYLGVFAVNLALAAVFLRGVLPGREPILLQLIRQMGLGPEGTAAFRRFVHRQCWVWAGLSATTAAAAAVATLSEALRAEAGLAITGLLAFQVVWFVATHRYATRRYARPETWRRTLATLSDPAAWSALEI